jgi:pyruvate/2-oxoglutarate dehydrogenase complex dihydrolipoamide acyltransferase (E2) component
MIEVTMPMFGEVMEEGTIAVWKKQAGDRVQKGEILAEIEMDKAVMPLECNASGVLAEILVPAGEPAVVNALLAIIQED